MKKCLIIFTGIFSVLFVFHTSVEAKVLPRFQTPAKKTTATTSVIRYVSAKLRDDRKALLVTFTNLQNAKSVEYILTYNGSGADQGVTGSVDVEGETSASRTLVFGTESKGVYTYHTNISNMKFVVTTVPKSGKTIVRKYTVKP